ncbi:MAG: hypothetical protein U9R44_02870 [Candidatus Omnitrophota bacterium]|nr:hypothetical protein [Candidatus Omnitrophota bacterium]
MKRPILHELRRHAPFTMFGAFTGIIVMVAFRNLPYRNAYTVFYALHPLHVILSALVTASMYKNYKCAQNGHKCNLFTLLAIGFFGSVGIATLSDSIIPFLGEKLLHMPHAEPHIGFIEEPFIVILFALAGVAIAYFRPATKFPHAGHVLISTWASLFHIMMAKGHGLTFFFGMAVFVFLFFAVWIPCCISDIVFPLLFIRKEDIGRKAAGAGHQTTDILQ